MTTTTNPNEAPATEVVESTTAKPSSMRLSPETRAALEDAKYRTGARTWDELIHSLLDGSATTKLFGADFPGRFDEVREMAMLTSKMLELFKASWVLSSGTEERVTQLMKATIADKDARIAALEEQLAGEAAARAEQQERITKLEAELDLMRRERDTAQMRADTLSQANELSELIKAMQSTAKAAIAKDGSDSDKGQGESPEGDEEELSPEEEDSLDKYDNRYDMADDEAPF